MRGLVTMFSLPNMPMEIHMITLPLGFTMGRNPEDISLWTATGNSSGATGFAG